MGSGISRNPAFGKWWSGRHVEGPAETWAYEAGHDWTYRWIGLKVLTVEDLLNGYATAKKFGRHLPPDKVSEVLRIAEEDARRLGEMFAGPKGVDPLSLLCAAACWSQLLHNEDKLRFAALVHVNTLGVLSPGELVLLFIRVLDGLMKIRGAPDRIYRPTVEAISTSIVRKLRSDGRVTQKAEYVTVDEFIQWGLADATVKPILAALRDPERDQKGLEVAPHQFVLPGERDYIRPPFPVEDVGPLSPLGSMKSPKSPKKSPSAKDTVPEKGFRPSRAGFEVEEEDEEEEEEEEGLVSVQVLVDVGLVDPEYAKEIYGDDVAFAEVTRTQYLAELCPQDPDVQTFCADAFDQLGPVPPPPPKPPPEKTALEKLEDQVHAHIEELELSDDRVALALLRKQRALDHRDREEQAAVLMQMKLTAVRMELRELKRRMPAHRAQASTAGSSTKFRGPAKERMPLARNFSGLETVQEAEDRKRRQRGLPKSKSAAALQAQQEAQHSRSVPAKAEERTPDAFADFLKEGTRDAEKKYMAKRYLYDGAVETWKKQANFESYVFKKWLSSQTGDDLSELTTMFSNSMWESKKKKENEDSSRTLADRGRQVLGGMGLGHSEESLDGPDGGGRQAKAKKSEAQIRATFAADALGDLGIGHMQDRFQRVKKSLVADSEFFPGKVHHEPQPQI